MQTTLNGHTTSIQANARSINGIKAEYTVKVDSGGRVSGFGLFGGRTADFAVNADKFYIAPPTGSSKGSTPFSVQTTAQTINGVRVPAGTYINDAFIKNGSIANAHIANGAITTAKIGNAQVDTLQIKGDAVIAPRAQTIDAPITLKRKTNSSGAWYDESLSSYDQWRLSLQEQVIFRVTAPPDANIHMINVSLSMWIGSVGKSEVSTRDDVSFDCMLYVLNKRTGKETFLDYATGRWLGTSAHPYQKIKFKWIPDQERMLKITSCFYFNNNNDPLEFYLAVTKDDNPDDWGCDSGSMSVISIKR